VLAGFTKPDWRHFIEVDGAPARFHTPPTPSPPD
jgi:hypothetical protein